MLAHTQAAPSCDTTFQQHFTVDYEYTVSFTRELFAANNLTLLHTISAREPAKCHRAICFIDEGVINACPALISDIAAYFDTHQQHLRLVGEPTIMQSGECIKSDIRHITLMQKIVADQHIDRHSYIIGIGGGALLDAVGLVAATSHRGIRHIRVPTTVLAQNDSGVGVKNSINLFGQKNYLGTFAPPHAVINDYSFIEALPTRDKIAGMAEAVKVALIRDDVFFHWLEANAPALAHFADEPMQHMIRRCAELHMQQIASGGDPFESGSARPLDFGHWAAHRLELQTDYELRHGEAVAIGIALDTHYSVLTGLLTEGSDERVCKLLETLGFNLWHDELGTLDSNGQFSVLRGLSDFKEHLGGELTITLLKSLGIGREVHHMDHAQLGHAIEWMRHRQAPAESQENRQVNRQLDRLPADSESATVAQSASLNLHHSTFETQAGSANQPSVLPSERITGVTAPATGTQRPNLAAIIKQLHQWLASRLSSDAGLWLEQRLQLIHDSNSERDLHITLGLIPRKLGRADLLLNSADIETAQRDAGLTWNPVNWRIDTAARCLVLTTLAHAHPENFNSRFEDLCKGAELNEAIAFYRCTAILPQSRVLDRVIGTGLRTHIRTIFEAIAHHNPYPQLHFDQNRWNHMVLKALFIDSTLHPIQGIDQRANKELAMVLCDYAHERWAAHRSVAPELWRSVGPFATGHMLDDLHRVLNAELEMEQQAGLLALLSSPDADHACLRAQHPKWSAMIDNKTLSWDTLGSIPTGMHE